MMNSEVSTQSIVGSLAADFSREPLEKAIGALVVDLARQGTIDASGLRLLATTALICWMEQRGLRQDERLDRMARLQTQFEERN